MGFQPHSPHRRPESLDPSCVIFPLPECISGEDILSSWQIPNVGSLSCGVRANMVGKAMWAPLALALCRELVNQNPGKAVETSVTRKALKDARVVIPHTSLFNLPIWPVQKTVGSWRMKVGHRKFN